MKRTIKQAVADWHKAWDKSKSKWAWCLHHDVEIEPVVLPPIKRLEYILAKKPKSEQVFRVDNFRPVLFNITKPLKDHAKLYKKKLLLMTEAYKSYDKRPSFRKWKYYMKAYDNYTRASVAYIHGLRAMQEELNALHDTEVPGNTWNGKNVFGEDNGL